MECLLPCIVLRMQFTIPNNRKLTTSDRSRPAAPAAPPQLLLICLFTFSPLRHSVIPQYTDLPSGARLQNDVILNIFLDEKGPIEASSTLKPDYLFSVQPYILELEESTRVRE